MVASLEGYDVISMREIENALAAKRLLVRFDAEDLRQGAASQLFPFTYVFARDGEAGRIRAILAADARLDDFVYVWFTDRPDWHKRRHSFKVNGVLRDVVAAKGRLPAGVKHVLWSDACRAVLSDWPMIRRIIVIKRRYRGRDLSIRAGLDVFVEYTLANEGREPRYIRLQRLAGHVLFAGRVTGPFMLEPK